MNEYSSDTKRVAERLAGMTEACANVHDDERNDIKFVPWHSGKCPVPAGHDVSIKYRGGYYSRMSHPEKYRWNHDGDDGDIVGYFDHTAESERLSELFALAPVDATHIDPFTTSIGAKYLKHISGDAFACFDGDGWLDCMLPENIIRRLLEIPRSERELNRLADDPEMTMGKVNQWTYAGYTFTPEQWQTRRQQRIAAGLIDVDGTDVVDIQDSQQDEVSEPDWDSAPEGATHWDKDDLTFPWLKLTKNGWLSWYPSDSEWIEPVPGSVVESYLIPRPQPKEQSQEWDGNGWPPVYTNVEWYNGKHHFWVDTQVIAYNKDHSAAWIEGEGVVSLDNVHVHFRPIKSAEEKRRDSMISDMAKVMFEAGANIGEPGAINDTTLGDLYDWLVSTNRLTGGE